MPQSPQIFKRPTRMLMVLTFSHQWIISLRDGDGYCSQYVTCGSGDASGSAPWEELMWLCAHPGVTRLRNSSGLRVQLQHTASSTFCRPGCCWVCTVQLEQAAGASALCFWPVLSRNHSNRTHSVGWWTLRNVALVWSRSRLRKNLDIGMGK